MVSNASEVTTEGGIEMRLLLLLLLVWFSFWGFLCISLGFLFVVGLFCQYHSQVIGWKDSSPK